MDEEGQAAHLPDDVLAAILRRVPPRWLAASRCVCRAWRDAVDGRRLLRADLLPLSLAGLFVHFDEHKYPEFLARPSSSATSGDLSFLPSASPHRGRFWEKEDCVDFDDYNIVDSCNGLLLLRGNYVVNPATRRWHALPTCPPKSFTGGVSYRTYLVYDPMISPYYEVFNIPILSLYLHGDEADPSMEESEWPPSRCKMYVFSSKSGHWEEKYFVREGDAAGTVHDMRECFGRFNAVYFRGALYVHCRPYFLMRMSLSDNTYSVIKPPVDLRVDGYLDVHIARSKKGVYIVAFDSSWASRKCWLRVWILNESCGQMEWMLKHNKDIKHVLAGHHISGRDQWILENINYSLFLSSSCQEDSKKTTTKENYEWNSDEDVEEEEDIVDYGGYLEDKKVVVENKLVWNSNNDNALNYGGMSEDWDEERYDDSRDQDLRILGFHPYKEIVFLSASEQTCLAYHLNGLKIEALGNIYPKDYCYFKSLPNEREWIRSSPYTPCWMEEFP